MLVVVSRIKDWNPGKSYLSVGMMELLEGDISFFFLLEVLLVINCRDVLVQCASRSKVNTSIVVTMKSSTLILLQPPEGMRGKKKIKLGGDVGGDGEWRGRKVYGRRTAELTTLFCWWFIFRKNSSLHKQFYCTPSSTDMQTVCSPAAFPSSPERRQNR